MGMIRLIVIKFYVKDAKKKRGAKMSPDNSYVAHFINTDEIESQHG